MRRTVAVAGLAGFLAGAFCTALLVWRYGNFVGQANPQVDASLAPAVERWIHGVDDAGAGAIVEGMPAQSAESEETATASPVIRPAEPPPAPEGTTGEATNLPVDLLDRRLEIPVDGIERAQLVRSFDDPRGGSRRHEAIDILAPRHTAVLAVEGGTIARLFKSRAGGLTIYQYDPTERYVYYYAHLDRYAAGLREGDRIARGQTIGYVGTTGNAPPDTPHLHFAIFRLHETKRWWEGTAVDPYEILKRVR